tara:strand:+ start:1816 stop:1923 length:108 start_codon:yes stop_codon:yes gene_type:complete
MNEIVKKLNDMIPADAPKYVRTALDEVKRYLEELE